MLTIQGGGGGFVEAIVLPTSPYFFLGSSMSWHHRGDRRSRSPQSLGSIKSVLGNLRQKNGGLGAC
ncbi:MAG: hypothetical protein ACO37W_09365 [Prochlorotrichaceae cyanobacterium]